VLVSAVLAPLLAAWVLKRQGGDRSHEIAAEADAEAVLAHDAATAAAAPDRDLDPGRDDSAGRRRPTDGGAA